MSFKIVKNSVDKLPEILKKN